MEHDQQERRGASRVARLPRRTKGRRVGWTALVVTSSSRGDVPWPRARPTVVNGTPVGRATGRSEIPSRKRASVPASSALRAFLRGIRPHQGPSFDVTQRERPRRACCHRVPPAALMVPANYTSAVPYSTEQLLHSTARGWRLRRIMPWNRRLDRWVEDCRWVLCCKGSQCNAAIPCRLSRIATP